MGKKCGRIDKGDDYDEKGNKVMTFIKPIVFIGNVLRYSLRIWNNRIKERDIEKTAHYAKLEWTLSDGKIIKGKESYRWRRANP